MNKTLTVFFILLACSVTAPAQNTEVLSPENQKAVATFIDCIKHHNAAKLATITLFPLQREYPIPPVKTKADLIRRYNDIFDDSVTKVICASDPAKDWEIVGWRGISSPGGGVWLRDDNGEVLAINYTSKAERLLKEKLIAADRTALHPSLRQYTRPVMILKTATYRIRIDDMGDEHYRYTSWKLNSPLGDKPDVLINNGEIDFQGSGGNHSFNFKNAGYIYECRIVMMGGADEAPAYLVVSNGAKQILSQRAQVLE